MAFVWAFFPQRESDKGSDLSLMLQIRIYYSDQLAQHKERKGQS